MLMLAGRDAFIIDDYPPINKCRIFGKGQTF